MADMETYTDEDAYDDVTGFHNTSLGDRTKSPPLPPPRKPAHDSHYLNRSFGSVNSLQATGFEKYVEAGSTMSLYDPRYGNTTLSKYTESRLLYCAPRVSGTTERSVPATLPRGPVSPGTMNNSRPIVRVPSEYQLPSEIFLRERAHESYSRFTSTKNLDSVDDRNGMHVKESVFTSEKWTVEELTNMYDKGDIKQKLDITQYIATKGLKFLKGRDIAGVAKLLTIDSNTITAIIVPFLLEKTLELHHTDDVDIVFEALNILIDKFHKDYHSIILIVCNMVCFVHLKSCGQHIRKKEICKKYLHACKTVLSRSKRKSCTSVCCSVLAQFMEQFKSKKDSSNQSHVTENGRKRDTNFRSMGFFEQYSCLFEIINKIFTTATNMTQVEALLEVVGSIVEQKQKPQTDECQKQESLLRLITLSWIFLLKNDNYLDLKSLEFTQRLLDLLKSIFSDKNVLQETRISLIANLEPLLLTENTDIAKHILEMFIKNHRCPVQMSKLVKNFIERELHHTGIKLANDTSLNEQTPNWQAIEGLFMDSREIVVHCLVPTQACLTKGYSEYKYKSNKNTTEKHLNNLEILQHLQVGSTHPSIIELFAYQRQPIPMLYIIEKMSSITLNEYLLNKRRRSHWIGHNKLANLACQAIDVLMFLHEKHIIHRGLTSHSFLMCNGGQTLVLHDFSIAIMTENCAESTTGTNCQLIPTLWSSPESILEDKFSMKSDTWMLGHVIYEIFTHGCQPYTEMYTFSIDKILSYVVFHHLKPKRWPCIPPEIYDLIKGAQHYQPKKRIDLSEILKHMKDFVCQSPDILDLERNGSTSKEKMTYSEKRRKLIEAWDGLRNNLLTTRLAEFSPATHTCCFCGVHIPEIIYCRDCGPNAYFCHSCHTRTHKNILFHRAYQWKESMYVPLLVTNELSRTDHFCETVYTSTIYAVDVKGSQHICNVALCRCEDSAVTLLRYNLWPATPTNPKIAFDMSFMELLSVLQLECHLPAKTFCESLASMHSNFINVSTFSEKNIYRAVVGDCLTEYNFHRSSLNTRNDITESTFGMECPICLKVPPIVSLDANFGLVHKLSSGDGHGRQFARHKSSYFLDHGKLTRFIDDYSADKKPFNSDCSNFQAGNVIRSKVKNKKLDVTGIFGSVCKHDFPISFIDLAHGERLSYPVYLIQSILENRTDKNLVVLYDIGCMLHKHLKKTENNMVLEKCTFAVPVFHSFAHNTACQLTYGQRYAKSTGMTDGEGIERLWSYLRGFKRITKEMSIGNRQDLLTEAMLHHTDKQIWNLDQRLTDKKKKCEKIIADTEKMVTEVLADLNESEEKIDIWLTDWKSMCSKNDQKACSLTADEQYAEFLQKIEIEKGKLQTAETMEEKGIIETTIEKLTQECKKHKRKANNKDLAIQSDQGQILLNSAKRKKQKAILTKLKELSTDRQYLSSLMKKYAEGQAIGIRISKQFSTNLNKIKKEVENFNAVFDSDENIQNFLSPSSEIYNQLETRKLSEKQQKVIQAKSLLDHAKEEVSNIEVEMNKYLLHLSWQSSEIMQLISYVSGLEKSRDSLGKLHYLNYKHFQIEKLFNSCTKLFECNVSDIQVPNMVHDFLQKNIASSQISQVPLNLDMPSEEEMQEILAEVELLESVDYRADGEEDEDDEDDDDGGSEEEL